MDWINLAFRLPYLVALGIAVVVSLSQCGRYKLPGILAASGFGIALVLSLSIATIHSTISNLIGDRLLDHRIVMILTSSLSAISVGLLVSAVFAGRPKTATAKDVPKASVDFALAQLGEGKSNDQIENGLAKRGLDPVAVGAVMHQIEVQQSHKAGWRNLIFGSLICTLGILATVVAYLLAAGAPGGGRYIVTYGPIVAGGAQAVRGMMQIGE